jgi:hypothetical protein
VKSSTHLNLSKVVFTGKGASKYLRKRRLLTFSIPLPFGSKNNVEDFKKVY